MTEQDYNWKDNKTKYMGNYLKAKQDENSFEFKDEGVGVAKDGDFPAAVLFDGNLNGEDGLFRMPKTLLKQVAAVDGLLVGKKISFRRYGTTKTDTKYVDFKWID